MLSFATLFINSDGLLIVVVILDDFDKLLEKLVLEGKIVVILHKGSKGIVFDRTYANMKNCVFVCSKCKTVHGDKNLILPNNKGSGDSIR